MKKIYTTKYSNNIKKSQGLPPGVNNKDIEDRFGEPEYEVNEQGEEVFNITRDWDAYWDHQWGNQEFSINGKRDLQVVADYKIRGFVDDLANSKIDVDVKEIYDKKSGKNVSKYELTDEEENSIEDLLIDWYIM